MKKKINVGVIGGGNMGAAIIAGIRSKFNVRVCEKTRSRRLFLKQRYRLSAVSLERLTDTSEVIILAVKPQDFNGILKELKTYISTKHLVISIAAGITTQFIQKRLGGRVKTIRAMPNLPSQIGMGMTALARGKYASSSDIRTAKRIFQSIGLTVTVGENKIDAVTATSGSGPAYVFYFVESFLKAAQKTGLTKKEAVDLVFQTMEGSLKLLEVSARGATALRENVTSKGGTTEAALKEFKKGKFDQIMVRALLAAKKRSKELSQ